jgi:hypothetical protein
MYDQVDMAEAHADAQEKEQEEFDAENARDPEEIFWSVPPKKRQNEDEIDSLIGDCLILADAYKKLGRLIKAHNASTDQNHHTTRDALMVGATRLDEAVFACAKNIDGIFRSVVQKEIDRRACR